MGKKLTSTRKVLGFDRDEAYKREACMEMDNIRKDHIRDSNAARAADHKARTEARERARWNAGRR